MNIFRRLAERRRRDDRGRYVCTLCGATFEEPRIVICPKCRGFVVPREGR